jgi:hypothetical protein
MGVRQKKRALVPCVYLSAPQGEKKGNGTPDPALKYGAIIRVVLINRTGLLNSKGLA